MMSGTVIRIVSGTGSKWLLMLSLVLLVSGSTTAREMTLDQAIEHALGHTARGDMIKGNLDVAEQYYRARRTNMYVPEIAINGSLPTYSINESYRGLTNAFDKQLFESRDMAFISNIEAKQSLLTGGTLTATANLNAQGNRYPYTGGDADRIGFVDETNWSRFFGFNLEQPLFRPSSVKNELHNREDDLEIARITKLEEEAELKREVTEAYVGLLKLSLQAEIAGDKLEGARLQEQIDSAKLADGVVSEEDRLLSSADRLDAELEFFEKETEFDEQKRELNILLDFDALEQLELEEPATPARMDSVKTDRFIMSWEESAPIIKAESQFSKAERQANYAASGHGLTGDLNANLSFGQDDVTREFEDGGALDEKPKTNNWTVSLDFRLPVWDGGAGSAAIKAARYEAEKAKYEFTRAKRSARAQLANLINQLDVSYQRLDIMKQQINLAKARLAIAEDRFADGQISQLTLLDSRVFYLETKNKYLEELEKYLLNQIELDSRFTS